MFSTFSLSSKQLSAPVRVILNPGRGEHGATTVNIPSVIDCAGLNSHVLMPMLSNRTANKRPSSSAASPNDISQSPHGTSYLTRKAFLRLCAASPQAVSLLGEPFTCTCPQLMAP